MRIVAFVRAEAEKKVVASDSLPLPNIAMKPPAISP